MLKCSKIGYNIKELMKINIYIWFNTQLFMNISRFVPCQITICIVMLIMLTSPYLCRKMMKKTGGSKLMTSTVYIYMFSLLIIMANFEKFFFRPNYKYLKLCINDK